MDRVRRGVAVEWFPAAERDAQVAALREPWIGEEGPLSADFRRDGAPALPRGLAFDATATVVWDEDGVQVLRPAPPSADVVDLESPVLLHERWAGKGPQSLRRIDFLRRGALLGSLFTTESDGHA